MGHRELARPPVLGAVMAADSIPTEVSISITGTDRPSVVLYAAKVDARVK